MPDISKCNGGDCRLKDKCYRYTSKPDAIWQSYFGLAPHKDGKCDWFWEDKGDYNE